MTQEEARELHILLLSLLGIFHEKFSFKFRQHSHFPPEVKKNLLKIINILYENDQLTSTEIGRILDIEKGSLTTMIDQLEGMGFVNRAADPNDRRKCLLSLSETGKEQMDKTMEQYTQSVAEIFGGKKPEELQQFRDNLRYVVAFMKGI